MFSYVPALLADGHRQLLLRLPAAIRNCISASADTWTCGCGHAHRYEPIRTDRATTLTVTCPGCHRTATLRAAGRRANQDRDVQVELGEPGPRIASAGHPCYGAAASSGATS